MWARAPHRATGRALGVVLAVSVLAPNADGEVPNGDEPAAEADDRQAERGGSPSAAETSGDIVVDRAVVRFMAPEIGGPENPLFIFERPLAFEARLVALADPAHQNKSVPYRRHHLQAALERHIAESLLSSLKMRPEPDAATVKRQMKAARQIATQQAGGEDRLLEAAKKEGLGAMELRRMFRRRARASLYLDRMVAPMLVPSELTLRRAHQSRQTPYSDHKYEEVEEPLRRWLVSRRLRTAVANFYQNARARLTIDYL